MALHVRGLQFGLDPLIAEAKRRRRRTQVALAVLGLVALTAAAVFAVGRGGEPPSSSRPPAGGAAHGRPRTLGATHVRDVFAQHGLRPSLAFDTRTANQAEIDRIAPLRGDNAARLAATLERRLLRHALAAGAAHPVIWLFYPTVGTEVLVWGKLGDAKTDIRKQEQFLAKQEAQLRAARRAGHQVIGGPPRAIRVGNLVVTTARFAKGEPERLKAALAELAKTS